MNLISINLACKSLDIICCGDIRGDRLIWSCELGYVVEER